MRAHPLLCSVSVGRSNACIKNGSIESPATAEGKGKVERKNEVLQTLLNDSNPDDGVATIESPTLLPPATILGSGSAMAPEPEASECENQANVTTASSPRKWSLFGRSSGHRSEKKKL